MEQDYYGFYCNCPCSDVHIRLIIIVFWVLVLLVCRFRWLWLVLVCWLYEFVVDAVITWVPYWGDSPRGCLGIKESKHSVLLWLLLDWFGQMWFGMLVGFSCLLSVVFEATACVTSKCMSEMVFIYVCNHIIICWYIYIFILILHIEPRKDLLNTTIFPTQSAYVYSNITQLCCFQAFLFYRTFIGNCLPEKYKNT